MKLIVLVEYLEFYLKDLYDLNDHPHPSSSIQTVKNSPHETCLILGKFGIAAGNTAPLLCPSPNCPPALYPIAQAIPSSGNSGTCH